MKNQFKNTDFDSYDSLSDKQEDYQETEFENESGILFAVKVLAILTFLGVLSFAGSSIANFILNNF